jgi:hypothetical protein
LPTTAYNSRVGDFFESTCGIVGAPPRTAAVYALSFYTEAPSNAGLASDVGLASDAERPADAWGRVAICNPLRAVARPDISGPDLFARRRRSLVWAKYRHDHT